MTQAKKIPAVKGRDKKLLLKLKLFNALHVCSGAGIDADFVARIDEQGNLNIVTRFQRRGFIAGFRSIALNTGLGRSDLKLHEIGRNNAECLAFI